jgi:hypothetical protein
MRSSICVAVVATCFALTPTGCNKPGTDASSTPPSQQGDKTADPGRVSQPKAVQRDPEPVQPKDTKAAEFQAGVKKFIEEARSLTRAMELLPDRASYKKRIDSIEEVYSRIPEPPPGNEALGMCYKAARQITVNFKGGDLYLKFIDDFLRLGSKEGADKSVKQFRELGSKQKADLDELESALKEGRVPKVELSDVIKGKK